MALQWCWSNLEDLDALVETRVEVLRAANLLDEHTDMRAVAEQSRQYYRESMTAGTHAALLVYDGERIVGTGGVSFYQVMPTYHNSSGRKAYIMNMYTHPDYRRQGIALHTLDMLVQECKARGIAQIGLEATEAGKPLYEKYGFTNADGEMRLQ